MFKPPKSMFFLVFLFVLVLSVGVAQANDGQEEKIEKTTLYITYGAAVMIAMTLGAMYAQIMNHLVDKYHLLKELNKSGLLNIRLILFCLSGQMLAFLFFIGVLLLRLSDSPPSGLGNLVIFPLIISQVLYVIAYVLSYSKYLIFKEP